MATSERDAPLSMESVFRELADRDDAPTPWIYGRDMHEYRERLLAAYRKGGDDGNE